MKKLLFIIFFLPSVPLFSQSKFVIDSKTASVVNGKAVLIRTAPSEFYPFKLKQDTVLVRNHLFQFTGTLKYPEQFRIYIFNKDNNQSLTEPFFIGAGSHKMTIDKASPPHDMFEVGFGVNLQNEPANDEYIKKYLPLYNDVNKQLDRYIEAKVKCNSITDTKKRKGCAIALEAEHVRLRNINDNILLTYTKGNRRSQIVPWLLYDAIRYHGYSDYYQNAFKDLSAYTPENINIPIRDLLEKQKLKAPGNLFALADFVKANVSKDIPQNRYILIDFWFSGCAPCVAQFNELKNVYKKFNKKGFEIIAVSIDKRKDIPTYKKLIEKNGYPWLQILDENGVKTKTIDINSFPTSFLLDSHWKIVKTPINPAVLNSFLEDHLL